MSGQRPALRGQGYMVKGGRRATVAHNAAATAAGEPAAAPDATDTPVQPLTAAHRTDGRASGRSAAARTYRMDAVLVTSAVAVGSAVATLAAWLVVLR